jgi:hypothetical protein
LTPTGEIVFKAAMAHLPARVITRASDSARRAPSSLTPLLP